MSDAMEALGRIQDVEDETRTQRAEALAAFERVLGGMSFVRGYNSRAYYADVETVRKALA